MLKIKLSRVGAKKQPYYRIIVAKARQKRDGKSVEIIGHFNPRTKDLSFSKERLTYWLSVGAQMTSSVERITKGEKQLKTPKNTKKSKEKGGKEKP